MPKTYLRFAAKSTVGVVASPAANVVVSADGITAFTGCLEDVGVWSLKTGAQLALLHSEDDHGEATCLELRPPSEKHLAVGHFDGRIHLWQLSDGQRVVTFNGHSSAVSTLAFNASGALLVSGSRDTQVIVWDVISETGLFKLRGHRDEVTRCRFMNNDAMVVSSSKDKLLKVWELSTQHCVQTCVGHRGEVWAFDVSPDEDRLITGSSDSQMRVWTVNSTATAPSLPATAAATDDDDTAAPRAGAGAGAGAGAEAGAGAGPGAGAGADAGAGPGASTAPPTTATPSFLTLYGSVNRVRNERAVTVAYSADGRFLVCQGNGKAVELYRVRTADEVKRRVQRRKRRQREKTKAKSKGKKKGDADDADADGGDDGALTLEPIAQDELELWGMLTTRAKVRSVAFINPERGHIGDSPVVSLCITFHNNLLETYSFMPGEAEVGKAAPHALRSVGVQGHRSDVRSLCVSADGGHVLTTSAGLTKLWNAATMTCIRTMACGFGLCCAFGPGDRHAIVGTKSGALQVFDLASGDLVESHDDAHDNTIWTLAVRPDGRGMVSGGADKQAKFWDFDLKEVPGSAGARTLTLVHTRTLKMADDILCVRYSHHEDPSKLLLAVSLLDCSVKVFFDDSLKFFLSLYGHKLPAMALDISSDNSLLVSGSADKNIKIWGLDFGDCHRSLFAHDDSVVSVAFVPRTHMLFTASKDRTIKYWDADRFEHILTLPGHKGEVWTLAVAPDGSAVYTGSNDRSVRVWSKTNEIVFLEEEQERRLEDALDKDVAEAQEETSALEAQGESARAGRRSGDTLKAVDRLVEALEFADDEAEKWQEFLFDKADATADAEQSKRRKHDDDDDDDDDDDAAAATAPTPGAAPSKNALFGGLTPSMFVLKTLREIRPSELEEALHALLLSQALQLLKHLHHALRRGLATELSVRCTMVLLKAHHRQLVSMGSLRGSLSSLKTFLQRRIREHKDQVGFNLAALRHHQRWVDAEKAAHQQPGVLAAPKPVRLGKRKEVHLF